MISLILEWLLTASWFIHVNNNRKHCEAKSKQVLEKSSELKQSNHFWHHSYNFRYSNNKPAVSLHAIVLFLTEGATYKVSWQMETKRCRKVTKVIFLMFDHYFTKTDNSQDNVPSQEIRESNTVWHIRSIQNCSLEHWNSAWNT